MKRKVLMLLIILKLSVCLFAQADTTEQSGQHFWKDKSISVGYQNGYVFQTNDFLRGHNTLAARLNRYQDLFIKLSGQTNGRRLWEQLYKYPVWGYGFYVADFHNPTEIGTPVALYMFMNAPFVRWNKGTFNYELSFGASANWKNFNPVTNKYNVAIGGLGAFFIDAGLNLDFELSNHLDLVTGFSMTHFSNGALKFPNSGINTIGPKVSLKYNLYDRPVFIRQPVPEFQAVNEWEFSTFAGAKNLIFIDSVRTDIVEQYEGLLFPVFGVTAVFNRQISRKSKFGLGVNLAYNSTVNAESAAKKARSSNDFDPVSGSLSDKIQISLFPSYELVVNKMSLILQPAYYIYRKKTAKQSPAFHQRIGLKYHFSEEVFVGLTLRDYAFHVSDYIEWSLGYTIRTKKNIYNQ